MNNKGQSSIEFLISFIFVFGFLILFLKISFLYTNGYLVHYATFMAGRAYAVHDRNSNRPDGSDVDAVNHANEVLRSFLIPRFITNFSNEVGVNAPDPAGTQFKNNLYVGVWVEYTDGFSIPGVSGGKKLINFRSEALLGREPTRSECSRRVCDALEDIGGNCRDHATINDNGC